MTLGGELWAIGCELWFVGCGPLAMGSGLLTIGCEDFGGFSGLDLFSIKLWMAWSSFVFLFAVE